MMKNSNLEEKRLKRMMVRILDLEKENIIKKDKTKEQMADEVRKVVESEVKRCY
jgi:hypothetical protein